MNEPRTILFVDDDPDMLEIGGIVLRKEGYDFMGAKTGEEGLNLVLDQQPDLVILDYFMPGINGSQFFENLVSGSRYLPVRETPVIMLTAASEQDVERKKLFELGLNAFLNKPFGNHELLNVIDNVFMLSDLRKKNKELTEQVKRTEYKYQDLIENASDLIFTLDRNSKFVFINRRLATICGLDKKSWIGKSFFQLIWRTDIDYAHEKFQKTMSGKATFFEVRITHANGKCIHLSVNINPIFEKAKVIGCVAIARDITEKKLLEHEIVELKNFMESIIESMGSGLITIDLEHRITSFNNGAAEILHLSPIDVLKKPLDGVFSKDVCQRLLINIDDPEQGLLNREMEFSSNNGDKPIFLGFSVTPRYDTQNKRVGTIISFKDITQIKQMQVEVQRMDRLASMGVLASGIAHEIRNPLAGIKTIAQSLEEDIQPEDPKREYVARIVRQVNRMDELLKTIFSYAKPRQPRRNMHTVQEIVQEVIALMENRMRAQGVTYEEIYHSELKKVYVDFYQIQQVFVNLFLNALDAMPDGGNLKLEAAPQVTIISRVDRRGRGLPVNSRYTPYAEIKLSDTGCGISTEAVNAVFNPFFTTKPQGAGLGLSIVYRIITEHAGDIQIKSEIGQGTTFKLLLPTEE